MEIRNNREHTGIDRHRRQWPRDVFVATALTLAALVLLGLTFVGDRGNAPPPFATDVAHK